MSFGHPIWPRFLPSQTVLTIATVGPVGRMRHAPGTWGSFAGLMYQLVFFHYLPVVGSLVFSALGVWFAMAICGEAEFRLGRRDPGEVVLDEFVAMPLCFLGWPAMAGVLPNWAAPWLVFIAGFLLFRLFDITKPLGISRLQDLPGGWGVVMDDVAAALVTCGLLHASAWTMTYFSRT
jgi:phosphatidylglycerophosphatase A